MSLDATGVCNMYIDYTAYAQYEFVQYAEYVQYADYVQNVEYLQGQTCSICVCDQVVCV